MNSVIMLGSFRAFMKLIPPNEILGLSRLYPGACLLAVFLAPFCFEKHPSLAATLVYIALVLAFLIILCKTIDARIKYKAAKFIWAIELFFYTAETYFAILLTGLASYLLISGEKYELKQLHELSAALTIIMMQFCGYIILIITVFNAIKESKLLSVKEIKHNKKVFKLFILVLILIAAVVGISVYMASLFYRSTAGLMFLLYK